MNKTMRIEQGEYKLLKDGSIEVILPEENELARSNSNTSSIRTIEEIEREEDERYEILYQLSQKLPEGVKPEDVENVEAYPHYIPKGFNVEKIKYSEQYELYYLQQEGYRLTYVPICQLEETIERFEIFFSEEYIIERWRSTYTWSRKVAPHDKKIENELATLRRLHDTFVKALYNRPLVKGIWIFTFYPTVDRKSKEVKLWLQQGNNRIFTSNANNIQETIKKLMPENGSCIILKTVYYSMIAVYLKMMFKRLENGEDEFSESELAMGRNNPYMEFLMGNENCFRNLLKNKEFCPWYNSVEWEYEEGRKKRLIRPGTWTSGFRNERLDDTDLELYNAYAGELLPIGGWFEIFVQDDLKSKKRTNSVVRPRHIAMYLCREETDENLAKIGLEFGGRDHSTVSTAIDKLKEELETNDNLNNMLKEIKTKLQ